MGGPVTARLVGLDGLPTQAISEFRLPGLSTGAVLLQTDLAATGQGTITVRVQSLSNQAMTALATAKVSAGVTAEATTTHLVPTPNPATPGRPVTFIAIVTAAGGGTPTGAATFTVDGVPQPPVPLAATAGGAQAVLTIAAPGAGVHIITASYGGGPGLAASASGPVALSVAALDVVGPIITSVERFGVHLQPTRLVLTFDEALDPAGATNLANFRLVGPGRDGRLGTRDDRVIRLIGASYDPTTRSVTLRPFERLPFRDRFRLTVLGGGAPGVVDLSGNRLDGDGDGRPGGDAVLPITRANLVTPSAVGGLRRQKALRKSDGRNARPIAEPSVRPSARAVDALLVSGTRLAPVPRGGGPTR